MNVLKAVLLCMFTVSVVVAPAIARPPSLADFRNLAGVSDVQIAPDGSRVVFVRSVGDYRRDKWNRTLAVVSTRGGSLQTITGVMHTLSSPQWSPSSDRIAYIANDKHGTAQVFVIGSGGSPARQITNAKNDVEQFSWSPDGTRVAYVTEDPSNDALWSVHDEGYLREKGPQPSHIWIAGANGGAVERLTHGSWSVLESAPPFVGSATAPTWSTDGKTIAFTMQSDADDSDSDRTSIATVDVTSGAISKVTSRTQYEYQPLFAPHGSQLAFLYPHGPGPISVLDVHVATGHDDRDVTPALDRDVTQVVWLRGNRIAMLTDTGIRDALYIQTTQAAPAQRVDLGVLNPSMISSANTGAIAMIASATDAPPEVYVLDSPSSKPRRLTNLNAPLAALTYGKSREITWTAADGQRSDGILTYPANYVTTKTYPLVLRIHGGPEAASTLAFSPLRQLLAARGYFVFEPNYRGSDNLGSAHEHGIYKDPGVGPGHDVMAGVAAIEKLGIVDTSREAVTGHSYGGFMTTWIIGHWHRWRCAVVGDGMVDWKEEYNLSAAGNLAWARDSLGGSPWNSSSAAIYISGSPMTYAGAITTPTRVISGTADQTVPASESFELYHALHDRGVPVSFIAIPGAHHFPDDPVHIEGYDRVTLSWVERWL